jgi:hypothetical protein
VTVGDPFSRASTALEESERHLVETSTKGSFVESLLSNHLVVLLCADMQQALYAIADEVASTSGDRRVAEFIRNSSRRVLRSVRKDEIATFVGLFGSDRKEALNGGLDDRDVTVYNNAVSDRHDVAHKASSGVTLADVRAALGAARKILSRVETVLGS